MLKTKKRGFTAPRRSVRRGQKVPRTRRKENRSGVVYCFFDYFSPTDAKYLL